MRKAQLAYSRQIHDKRIYGTNVYECCIPHIVRALFKYEEELAKKRVIISSNGKYMYTPSKKYIEFLKHHSSFKNKPTNYVNRNEDKSDQRDIREI